MSDKVIKILKLFALSLLLLFLVRFSLWLLYSSDFMQLNTSETLLSFWSGFRIDLITIATFCALPILLLLLPFTFADSPLWQKLIGYFWYLILIVILFVLLSDMVYFQYVHRHIGHEILAMGDDAHVITDMMQEYKLLILLYLGISALLFFIFKKILLSKTKHAEQTFVKKSSILFLAILLLFLSIRGKLTGMSYSISDAFVVNKVASGNLALNGFFTFYRTLSQNKKNYHFFEDKEAIQTVQNLLTSKSFRFCDTTHPMIRECQDFKKNTTAYNIVIVLLESWSAKYIDSFSGHHLGVTPHFDALSKESIHFSNFYANGQRSIEGITALFTGLPVLKGFDFLGSGLEMSALSYLGNKAKENGYSTIAMQSSDRGSFRIDAVSKIAGFDHYYGAEDMPLVGEEDRDKKPRFGTWDGNMYHLLLEKLSTQKEPFLSFAFTSVTHPPFISPGKKWETYPHSTTNIFGFLNTLKYADDALGKFIQNAKQKPWFDNTIFLFLADHTLGTGDDSAFFKQTNITLKNRPLEEMKIPLLIYAPKIFKPRMIETISSQTDILPTLMHLLHWKGSFSTLSNSLLEPTKEPFALFNMGEVVGLVNPSGYIKHTLDKTLELTGDASLEKKILSLYQSSNQLLQKNLWYSQSPLKSIQNAK